MMADAANRFAAEDSGAARASVSHPDPGHVYLDW